MRPIGDSGDGFVTLGDGSLRWGRFGAAGILVRHLDAENEPSYFVAKRSPGSHHGGTWAVPGGAINRGETVFEAALREFEEEIGVPLGEHTVVGVYEDDHGGWSYWTILVEVPERLTPPEVLPWESVATRWVSPSELEGLDLHEAFEATLHRIGVLPSSSGPP